MAVIAHFFLLCLMIIHLGCTRTVYASHGSQNRTLSSSRGQKQLADKKVQSKNSWWRQKLTHGNRSVQQNTNGTKSDCSADTVSVVLQSNTRWHSRHELGCPVECECNATFADCTSRELDKIPDIDDFSKDMQELKLDRNSIHRIDLYNDPKNWPSSPFARGFIKLSARHNDANFVNLTSIRAKTVDLSFNNLSNIQPCDKKHPIEELYLGNNIFQKVPQALRGKSLCRLTTLDLSNNALGFNKPLLPENLSRLYRLRNLKLAGNSISSVETYDFLPLKTSELNELDLSRNGLTSIDATFPFKSLKKIYHLDLSNNQLNNSTFRNLSKILGNVTVRFLSLANNAPALGNLIHEDVSLFHAPGYGHLKMLNLSGNELGTIKNNMFKGLTKLEILDLRNNKLANLEEKSFAMLYRLKVLNLAGNRFAVLEKSWFQWVHPGTVLQLNLSHNPFRCDCAEINIFSDPVKDEFHFVDFQEPGQYQCSHPESLKGHSVSGVLETCFPHKNGSLEVWHIVIVCVVLLVLVILVSLMASYLFHRRLNNRRGYEEIPGDIAMRNINIYVNANSNAAVALDSGNIMLHQSMQTDPSMRLMPKFHAFISYENDDREWVLYKLLPEIEDKRQLHLCVSDRDFPPGRSIFDNITAAISNCEKVVLVVTNKFLRSGWCMYEVRAALVKAQKGSETSIIMVLLEALGTNIPSEIQNLMDTMSYLQWPQNSQEQESFWTRLYQVLKPNSSQHSKESFEAN